MRMVMSVMMMRVAMALRTDLRWPQCGECALRLGNDGEGSCPQEAESNQEVATGCRRGVVTVRSEVRWHVLHVCLLRVSTFPASGLADD
jgi:hypothetical protein